MLVPIVLVCDDNADMREIAKMLLRTEGCLVIEAQDGREAVEVARASHPDLILLDLEMPGVDGFDAARELRRIDVTRSTPIVAVTASDGRRREAIDAGCNDCLTKPLLYDNIKHLLTHYVGHVGDTPGDTTA